MVNGFPAFLNQLASWVFEKRPVSFLLNEAFKEETCLSLFKESHLLLGFLHKLFMFNQRGGNSCGCSSFFFEAASFSLFKENHLLLGSFS